MACRVRVRGLNGEARHDLLVGVGVPLGEEVAERLLELGLHLLGVRAGVRTGQSRVNWLSPCPDPNPNPDPSLTLTRCTLV